MMSEYFYIAVFFLLSFSPYPPHVLINKAVSAIFDFRAVEDIYTFITSKNFYDPACYYFHR